MNIVVRRTATIRSRRHLTAVLTATIVAAVLLIPAAAPVRAAVGISLTDHDCGYDVTSNTFRPIVSITRTALTDPTDSRASVGLRLYDVDAPDVLLAQLGTGVTDDGVDLNGAFNVPDGFTRSFTPEAGAVFGDGASGGAALIQEHGYILRARLFDFSSVEESVVTVGTCVATPENVDIDTDQDGLTDAEETDIYGTDPLRKDTDGDKLEDGHEVLGFDSNGDDVIDLDLPTMGTHPTRTDVLVEIDSMVGDHSDGPFPASISLVQQAFQNSPWQNYDGSSGIALHVDYGPTAPLLGGGTWGSLSRANALAHDALLGTWADNEYKWAEFNALATANLDVIRRPFFRYNIWAHAIASDPAVPGTALGRARGIPESAFIVSLGTWTRSTFSDAGVFMHELGHSLGLGHGGHEDQNGKPNYPSVMNYLYTTQGVPVGGQAILDYSRQLLPPLDEASLDEAAGVGGGYGARWVDQTGTPQADLAGGPIDWFFNHQTDAGVSVDINAGSGGNTGIGVLTGHEDWSQLVFGGGAIGDFVGAYVPPAGTPADDEPTVEQQAALPAWPDEPPVANDQSTAISSDGTAVIELDAADPEGQSLSFTIVTGPTHGALDDCSFGSCTYTPAPGFAGTDTFTWKANDGTSDSNIATFTITVSAVTVTTVTNDATGAAALATAMVRDPSELTAAAFVAVPGSGTPHGTSTTLDDFPTNGASFAILTSGNASLADDPNLSPGSGQNIGGGNVRGNTDFDVTVLRLDLVAPTTANCLRIDLAFYSEEYPEFVGSFNDAFIAELDSSTWTTDGQAITAPRNFAFDASGDVISVNSSGATSMTAAAAAGTTYDGATVLLRAGTAVTPGAHSLFLSIFDQGDQVLDSAVFIDDVRFVRVQDPSVDCAEGAEIPTNDDPVAVDDTATTDEGVAVDVDVLANDSDANGDTLIVASVADPAHGTTAFNPDGTIKYTPEAGFSGTDTFEYTVNDGHDGNDTATVTVTVVGTANPPPTANAGVDKTGTEGSPISLDGTVTNTPATDTLTTLWSFSLGAGTDAGMGCTFGAAGQVDTTITCTDDGTVTVTLTANDGVNPAVSATATLTIGNANPTVDITAPAAAATFQTGVPVSLAATIGDAGSNDSHTCSIAWGDGTTTTGVVAAGACTGSHTYTTTGSKTITVTVTDDDTGQGSDSVDITIESPPANPPPTANAGVDKTGTEGSPISLDGTVNNTPATDTLTTLWSFSLGAGTDAGMGCTFGAAGQVDTTITCTDDGTVTVTLTANDGVNPAVSATATLTIGNANPTVDITAPAADSIANVGSTINLSADRGDPGSNDTHTCTIDWGDGSTSAGTLTATTCRGSHSYSSIGVPIIRVTITDDDGGSAFDEVMLVIAEAQTKVTGGGWINFGGGKLRFGFVAHPGTPNQGEIQVRWGKHKFHGKTVVDLLAVAPDASWSGSGRYDGTDGYTYQVTVFDGAKAKKKTTPDTFHIVVRDSSGATVLNATGNVGGGNIKIH